MFNIGQFAIKQSYTLEALRDALLPRLMSGEVRLMKMEKNK